jgi:arabinofuranosyltransferase
VDIFALSDPLLARLPANPDSRTGHFLRDIPAGYIETLETGQNRLTDPDLAAYYDQLRRVISGLGHAAALT